MNTRNGNLVNLVTLALLMALIFLMGQTPLGLIPLGFCNVTLLVIPVAVGTLFMGLKYGVLLGLTFGATSFVSALLRPLPVEEVPVGAAAGRVLARDLAALVDLPGFTNSARDGYAARHAVANRCMMEQLTSCRANSSLTRTPSMDSARYAL